MCKDFFISEEVTNLNFMDYVKALIDFIMKLVALFKNEDIPEETPEEKS